MSYQELIHLKYRLGLTTFELMQRFPEHLAKVREVALLEIPEETLREVVREEEILTRIVRLKKEFLKPAG